MISRPTIATTVPADHGGGTTAAITVIHPDIIQAHILTRLDGPTLASTSCASSLLNTLCYEENLWENICNSSWPSTTDPLVHDVISTFPSGHRSFFSDAYSSFHHGTQPPEYPSSLSEDRGSDISRLISAVDLHFGDKLICSRVFETDTTMSWFSCSPFRIDLLEQKEMLPTQVELGDDGGDGACMSRVEESLTLSWILIDPDRKRALNVSGVRPVAVGRHWLTGEFQLKYALDIPPNAAFGGGGTVQCRVVVARGGKGGRELQVKEVSMLVEDMEGLILSGEDSLVILQNGLEKERKMRKIGEEKIIYETFVNMKRDLNDKQQKIDKSLDMVCIGSGVMIMFIAFCTFMFFR